MYQPTPALDTAADESGAHLVAAGDRARGTGAGRWTARALARLLRPPTAAARPPAYRTLTGRWRSSSGVWTTGGGGEVSLPGPGGDTFAELLPGGRPPGGEESRDRAMEQLLYHLGRWIYLLDAQDDLEEDRAGAGVQSVAARFRTGGDPDAMAAHLDHSKSDVLRGPAG